MTKLIEALIWTGVLSTFVLTAAVYATDDFVCSDLVFPVMEAVEEGLLTDEHADTILKNCLKRRDTTNFV